MDLENFNDMIYQRYQRAQGKLSYIDFIAAIGCLPNPRTLLRGRNQMNSNKPSISAFDLHGNIIYANLLSIEATPQLRERETKKILSLLGRTKRS